MSYLYPVITFYVGFLLLLVAYFNKKKSFSKIIFWLSVAIFIIGFILFGMWAIVRAIV